jgi:hypothetical protein
MSYEIEMLSTEFTTAQLKVVAHVPQTKLYFFLPHLPSRNRKGVQMACFSFTHINQIKDITLKLIHL